jgi:hypothetical protein
MVIFSNELKASMYPFLYSRLKGWFMKIGIYIKLSNKIFEDQYKLPSLLAIK